MKIGDKVTKISGKPFQNGMKVGVIASIGTMTIPEAKDKIERNGPTKEVESVTLEGCEGPVRMNQLKGE